MKIGKLRLMSAHWRPVDVLLATESRYPRLPWRHWAVIRLEDEENHIGWMTHPSIPVDARVIVASVVHGRHGDLSVQDMARLVRAPKSTTYDAMRRIASSINPRHMVWYRRIYDHIRENR